MTNREKWEFEYSGTELGAAAQKQLDFRLGRVAWWREAKEKVMAEIKESGIEVSESVAAELANYSTKSLRGPQVMVRADLQDKLAECHGKIQTHQRAADEYAAWVAALIVHPEMRHRLTFADFQYFFGDGG